MVSTKAQDLTAHFAWWLTIEYTPSATQIDSIPVKVIHPSWSAASILTIKDVPSEEFEEFSQYHEALGYKFSHEGDFNKDGKKDKIVVGVYKEVSGSLGRFLLILTQKKPGVWKKDFLITILGEPGFSILWSKGSEVRWMDCMECDTGGILNWDGKKYSIEWHSCCGD